MGGDVRVCGGGPEDEVVRFLDSLAAVDEGLFLQFAAEAVDFVGVDAEGLADFFGGGAAVALGADEGEDAAGVGGGIGFDGEAHFYWLPWVNFLLDFGEGGLKVFEGADDGGDGAGLGPFLEAGGLEQGEGMAGAFEFEFEGDAMPDAVEVGIAGGLHGGAVAFAEGECRIAGFEPLEVVEAGFL